MNDEPKVGLPSEVQVAAEYLLAKAGEHGVTFAGFLFSADPLCLVNIGNCNDAAELRLYESLCELWARRAAAAPVKNIQLAVRQ